ncbi:hypothetical protein H6H01_03840 [Nostoc calcicola FACHB-3891]|nr:hypothetical protein [Nostoc calcicola FACHB-3891]MDZ8062981.1 hypothetical protein [Nostoc sp. EkiNYC01]
MSISEAAFNRFTIATVLVASPLGEVLMSVDSPFFPNLKACYAEALY